MGYLDCKNVDTAIRRAKAMLENRAKKHGDYENFGQDEVRSIRDKFIDITDYSPEMMEIRKKVDAFANWCATYTIY